MNKPAAPQMPEFARTGKGERAVLRTSAPAADFHDYRDRDGNAMDKVYSDWRSWETWPDERFNNGVQL